MKSDVSNACTRLHLILDACEPLFVLQQHGMHKLQQSLWTMLTPTAKHESRSHVITNDGLTKDIASCYETHLLYTIVGRQQVRVLDLLQSSSKSVSKTTSCEVWMSNYAIELRHPEHD